MPQDDLLRFQSSHFGDDSRPAVWFADAETALGYDAAAAFEEQQLDVLGYYADGSKRTLTEEQIAIFRHSEMMQLARDERRRREENASERESESLGRDDQRPVSPVSTSSLESELRGLARPKAPPTRKTTKSGGSSTLTTDPQRGAQKQKQKHKQQPRKRQSQVPYEQRNKRKWEGWIVDDDPEQGSITHRRQVREMDELRDDQVELDY